MASTLLSEQQRGTFQVAAVASASSGRVSVHETRLASAATLRSWAGRH